MSDVTREELDRIEKAANDSIQLQAAFVGDDVVFHPFDPRDIKRLVAAARRGLELETVAVAVAETSRIVAEQEAEIARLRSETERLALDLQRLRRVEARLRAVMLKPYHLRAMSHFILIHGDLESNGQMLTSILLSNIADETEDALAYTGDEPERREE